jgi:hypothetical protein
MILKEEGGNISALCQKRAEIGLFDENEVEKGVTG